MNLMNGWIIILIIALFFAGMYAYAHASVYFEKKKIKDEIKQKQLAEQLFEEEKQRKQEVRKEKFQKIKRRSEEIKQELRRLEEMKKARLKTKNSLG